MEQIIKEIYGIDTNNKIYNSRVDIESPSLLKKVLKYLENNKTAPKGTWNYLGMKQISPNAFLSELDVFDLLWKFTREFNQVALGTCQFGDVGLIDSKTRKANKDNPLKYNGCGGYSACWYNANISRRVSNFSRM